MSDAYPQPPLYDPTTDIPTMSARAVVEEALDHSSILYPGAVERYPEELQSAVSMIHRLSHGCRFFQAQTIIFQERSLFFQKQVKSIEAHHPDNPNNQRQPRDTVTTQTAVSILPVPDAVHSHNPAAALPDDSISGKTVSAPASNAASSTELAPPSPHGPGYWARHNPGKSSVKRPWDGKPKMKLSGRSAS